MWLVLLAEAGGIAEANTLSSPATLPCWYLVIAHPMVTKSRSDSMRLCQLGTQDLPNNAAVDLDVLDMFINSPIDSRKTAQYVCVSLLAKVCRGLHTV